MSETFPLLFVSAHAIAQFRQRIADLGDDKARDFILSGVRQATNVFPLPDGNTMRVRTRRPFPFEFRAYCVYDAEKQAWVVATIVRGDSHVTRKQKLQQAKQGTDRPENRPEDRHDE
ncbi:MAG: hypothetical protein ACKV2V_10170 [Blastocatellia bacterium]